MIRQRDQMAADLDCRLQGADRAHAGSTMIRHPQPHPAFSVREFWGRKKRCILEIRKLNGRQIVETQTQQMRCSALCVRGLT